jgi:hypothetical protein
MFYYVVLEKRENGDTYITGMNVTKNAMENGYCVSKEQMKELIPLLNDPNVAVKVKDDYQDNFDWEVVDATENLDILKDLAMTDVQNKFNASMNVVAVFELYNVMMINNELAANGYFITNDNREEKYIDIINSGDENLITLLQTYLEMKDRIDPMWEYYNKVNEFKLTLKDMETIEEVTTARDNLISYIN